MKLAAVSSISLIIPYSEGGGCLTWYSPDQSWDGSRRSLPRSWQQFATYHWLFPSVREGGRGGREGLTWYSPDQSWDGSRRSLPRSWQQFATYHWLFPSAAWACSLTRWVGGDSCWSSPESGAGTGSAMPAGEVPSSGRHPAPWIGSYEVTENVQI